jgi:hypothetical protein
VMTSARGIGVGGGVETGAAEMEVVGIGGSWAASRSS